MLFSANRGSGWLGGMNFGHHGGGVNVCVMVKNNQRTSSGRPRKPRRRRRLPSLGLCIACQRIPTS